jgi:hypothetical protein
MKRYMPPLAYDARARLVPVVAASSRQVVPMERFVVELPHRPLRKPFKSVFLGDEWKEGPRFSVGGNWKVVIEVRA